MENLDNELVVSENGEVTSLPESMQVYQAIYNEITGKTEVISDSVSKFLKIELNDLHQLNKLFEQFLEQYEVSAFNSSITIFHTEGNKERFSSFDRLNFYNVSSSSPIERINLELNVLITPPKLVKPQSYKIVINLIAGAAIIGKAGSEIPDKISKALLMRAIQEKAIEFKVEYVDYIIARSISDLIKNWASTIVEHDTNKSIQKIQKYSHLIRVGFSTSFLMMAMLFTLYFSVLILPDSVESNAALAQFLIVSAFSIIVIKNIGEYLGRKVERAIDSINTNEVSFIFINAGDKKLYNEYQKDVRADKLRAFRSIVLGLFVGVASSIIATAIYSYMV